MYILRRKEEILVCDSSLEVYWSTLSNNLEFKQKYWKFKKKVQFYEITFFNYYYFTQKYETKVDTMVQVTTVKIFFLNYI